MTDRKVLKEISKELVLHCFRNTHLENIHAGKECGGVGYGFSDGEMKKLMIECVNNVYTYLVGKSENIFKPEIESWFFANRSSTAGWNEPQLIKEWIINERSHKPIKEK